MWSVRCRCGGSEELLVGAHLYDVQLINSLIIPYPISELNVLMVSRCKIFVMFATGCPVLDYETYTKYFHLIVPRSSL